MATATDASCINTQNFFQVVPEHLDHWKVLHRETANMQLTYARNKIPKGDAVDVYDALTTVIARRGGSKIVPATDLGLGNTYEDDNCEVTLRDGRQTGHSECSAISCEEIQTDNIEFSGGNCNTTRHIIESSGGHYRHEGERRRIKAGTDVKCLNDLAGLKPENQMELLMNEQETVSQTLIRSEDYEHFRYAVENAESNVVAKGRNNVDGVRPTFTGPNGWEYVEPEDIDHATIWLLLEVREHIAAQLLSHGKIMNMEDYMMPVSMDYRSWHMMVARHEQVMSSEHGLIRDGGIFANESIRRIMVEGSRKKEMVKMMNGRMRESEVWGNKLRIFFDDPVYGYMKPNGTFPSGLPRCTFVPIPRFIDVEANTVGGNGRGLIQIENPAWRDDFIICDGVQYEKLASICVIDDMSFKVHPVNRAASPAGVNQTPTDLSMNLMTGADVGVLTGCPNEDRTKYYWFAEQWLAFTKYIPEASSFIIHRPIRMPGYNSGLIPSADRGSIQVEAGTDLAQPESCAESEPCQDADCQEDTTVCTVADNVTSLSPCGGELDVPFFGGSEPQIVRFNVTRDKDCADVADASVAFAVTPAPADADACVLDSVYGTDYVVVDADGVTQSDSGTVEFAAGEYGTKEICIQILAAAPTLAAEDPTGPCCKDNEPKAQFTKFTVKLSGATGTTLDTCDEASAIISNATGDEPV